MKGILCYSRKQGLLLAFCAFVFSVLLSGVFLSHEANAADNERQITYWKSEGVSFQANDVNVGSGLTYEYLSDGNNHAAWQITPAPYASGWVTNLNFLRVWFYFPDLTGKQAANGEFHVVFYPNSNDQNWYCGNIVASLTATNVSTTLSNVSCKVYYENSSVAIRLTSKFTISPSTGSTFANNPEFYVTYTNKSGLNIPSRSKDYFISSSNSSYVPTNQTYLVMYDKLIIDSINYSTDPNTSILNNIDNKLDSIEDAINNQSENEKQQYEEQSQEVQEDLEDGSEAAEQQGATLIAMLTQFFTAIRDVPAANACNLNVSLKPYNNILPNAYQINFCTNGAKSFLQTKSISYSLFSGDPGVNRPSIWSLLSTVIFSCIIISLLFPTLNLIKKTYEELRK